MKKVIFICLIALVLFSCDNTTVVGKKIKPLELDSLVVKPIDTINNGK